MDEKNKPAKKKVAASGPGGKRGRRAGAKTTGRQAVNRDGAAGELRRRAEKIAGKEAPDTPENLGTLVPAETRKLLHELRVHQVELEMQNVELRTAEARLEESRAQYFDLYDLAPVGYFSISEKGIILEANLTGANMLGEVPGRLRAQPFTRFIVNDDQDIYYQHKKQLIETRRPQLCELRLVRGDGTAFWARVEATAVQDGKSGRPVCRAAVSDITTHKLAEEVTRKSEELYRSILDHMYDPYFEVDLAGNFTFVNEATCRNLGYTREELIGKSYRSLMPADEKAGIFEAFNSVFRSGEPNNGYAHRVISKAGKILFAESSIDIRRDKQGTATGFKSVSRDVTARKQVEEALLEANNRLALAQEASRSGAWDWDMVTGQLTWSNELFRILGLEPADASATFDTWRSVMHPEDRQKAEDRINEAIRDHRKLFNEYRIVLPSGEVRWVSAWGDTQYAPDGQATRMLGICIDTTELKQAEQALWENQARYQALVETANDFIWEVDINGAYTYCSPQMEQLWGLKPREMLGKTPFELMPPEEKELSAKLFTEFIRSGSSFTNMEIRGLDSSGQVRFLEISGVPFTDKEGGLKGYRGITRDITERRKAEVELQENEQRLYSIFNTVADVIFYLGVKGDEDFHFIAVNHAFYKTTGLDQDAVIGRNVTEVIPEPSLSMVLRKYRQAIREKTVIRWEETSDYPNGRLTAEVCISPVFNSNGECTNLVGSVHDITDVRRLEEEQQRIARLESVGVLAGGIAHDFNNILTSILGNISIARMETEQGSEVYKSLEQAEKASQRARDLTKQLLTFSKGGAPVTKLASLTELLRDTAGFALRGSNVKCHFAIPGDLWHAEIDTGQVSQVIQNLVINAQQAMPAGGAVEISAENITLSSTQNQARGLPLPKGNYIRIAVTDHGSGIANEHLDRVFDPFFTTKKKGSGLGLATSFSIARQHGGHLSVESQVGDGSTFSLYLPASPETVGPEDAEKQAIKPSAGARILVMDDEQGVREVAGRMLKLMGYTDIEFAVNGAEAIRLYGEAVRSGKPFSLVILDLTIPGGMGGREAIQKLFEMDPGVRAIVSSGYADHSVMAEYREYGFRGMASKPYSVEELGKAVRDALG